MMVLRYTNYAAYSHRSRLNNIKLSSLVPHDLSKEYNATCLFSHDDFILLNTASLTCIV